MTSPHIPLLVHAFAVDNDTPSLASTGTWPKKAVDVEGDVGQRAGQGHATQSQLGRKNMRDKKGGNGSHLWWAPLEKTFKAEETGDAQVDSYVRQTSKRFGNRFHYEHCSF